MGVDGLNEFQLWVAAEMKGEGRKQREKRGAHLQAGQARGTPGLRASQTGAGPRSWKPPVPSERGKASGSVLGSPALNWGNLSSRQVRSHQRTGNCWGVGLGFPKSSRGACRLTPAAASPATRPACCHRRPPEDVDAAVPVSEEEHVVIVVPGDLVHLKLELFLSFGAMRLGINEGDHVILVPDCNGLSVRAPTDVDVLPWSDQKGGRSRFHPAIHSSHEVSRRATFIPDSLTPNHSQTGKTARSAV